jgi:hypothetical protein
MPAVSIGSPWWTVPLLVVCAAGLMHHRYGAEPQAERDGPGECRRARVTGG